MANAAPLARARPLLAALACTGFVFAAAGSCGEGAVHYYTGGGGDGGYIPIGGGGPVPIADGGDGGPDGGDGGLGGGDGGGVAGCVDAGQVAFVTDYCFGSGAQVPMPPPLANGCSVTMSWSTGACTGTLSGSNDAFDGGCQGGGGTLHCAGTAFPGPLTCTGGGRQPCPLLFCINPSCTP